MDDLFRCLGWRFYCLIAPAVQPMFLYLLHGQPFLIFRAVSGGGNPFLRRHFHGLCLVCHWLCTSFFPLFLPHLLSLPSRIFLSDGCSSLELFSF